MWFNKGAEEEYAARKVDGKPETRSLIAQVEAQDEIAAVLEQRGERYGVFADNARVAQKLKDAMQIDTRYGELTMDKREALDQICSKISRIVTANASEYKDSWTDIQGYAKLVADTLED